MRLIDADELERVFIGKHYGVDAIKYFINMQPTIDTMPVKRGRWMVHPVWTVNPVYIKCSECGESFMLIPQNYCPNCGAKMDEEG